MTVLVELNLLLRSERMCLLHVHVCNAVTANQSQSHCICAKHLWMRISAFLCPSPVLKFEITILYKIRNQICCNKTWRCFVIVLPITHCFRLDISRPSPSYHIVRKSIHLSWFWTLFVTYINVFLSRINRYCKSTSLCCCKSPRFYCCKSPRFRCCTLSRFRCFNVEFSSFAFRITTM